MNRVLAFIKEIPALIKVDESMKLTLSLFLEWMYKDEIAGNKELGRQSGKSMYDRIVIAFKIFDAVPHDKERRAQCFNLCLLIGLGHEQEHHGINHDAKRAELWTIIAEDEVQFSEIAAVMSADEAMEISTTEDDGWNG